MNDELQDEYQNLYEDFEKLRVMKNKIILILDDMETDEDDKLSLIEKLVKEV